MNKIEIGGIIHELRGDKSLNSLAKESGLQVTQIRKIESGELKEPTYKTIEKILDALGYEIDIVLKREEGQ